VSALSRRFYVRLANEYKEARPQTGDGTTAYQVWLHMVMLTANTINATASTFDRARFLTACGVEDKVVAALG
jgi:hypothetical protein